MRGEFPAACATILVLITATRCEEMHTPGGPTSVSVGRTGGPSLASPQAGRMVVAGADAALGDDDFVLNSATIGGDTPAISASAGCGCRTHEFTLVIAASFVESSPVRLPAVVRHDANGDPCEAWPPESYAFDLALVRERCREVYGPGAGRVALELDGVAEDSLVCEFAYSEGKRSTFRRERNQHSEVKTIRRSGRERPERGASRRLRVRQPSCRKGGCDAEGTYRDATH